MNWVLWTTFHQSDGHILYCDNKNRWIKVWFGRMKIIWHEQVIFTLTAVTHVQYSTHYGTVTLGIEWIVWLMLMNQAMVPCTALPKQLVWADKQNSDPQQTSNWQKNITSLDAINENDKGWASLIWLQQEPKESRCHPSVHPREVEFIIVTLQASALGQFWSEEHETFFLAFWHMY